MNTNFQDQPRDFEGRTQTSDPSRDGGTSVEGTDGQDLAGRIPVIARQVLEQARRVPSIIDRELRENPYRLLGIVSGVGFGMGMLLGSRIMRTIVVSVGGYAITETLRAYVNDAIQKQAQDSTSH